MEVLFLYWCINFTILWCCKVTYYTYREIKSFTGTAKLEGPGPDIESGKGKSKKNRKY